MGAFLSVVGNKAGTTDCNEVLQSASCKRQRMSSIIREENPRLIPNLPDEISIQILARLPRIYYLNAELVSRSWRNALTSTELFDWRKDLGKIEEWLYILTKVEEDKLIWNAFDPSSKKWQRLPPMPSVTKEEPKKVFSGLADVIRTWLGRTDPLDRLPYCGCAIGAVNGCLYVLGGFSKASAMKSVWRFDPILNMWSEVESMTTGRAYCKTGVLKDKLYVVGGVSRGRGGLTPLQSAEVYDPCIGLWSQVPSMPFSRAQMLPNAFLADMLKPIATGMTSYRGRLCVPQSLYSWPFFVDVGGEVYDPETDKWLEMPSGMGDGWPARQAGTKLSVVVDEELYALDPSSSLDSGKIKIYSHQEDAWKVVMGKVPINDFTDSESPYLLAGFLGRLHVITKDVNHDVVILQADPHNRIKASSSASLSLVGSLPEQADPVVEAADPHNRIKASSSTSLSLVGSLQEQADTVVEAETEIWKVVTTRKFGSAELVSCQVLDI